MTYYTCTIILFLLDILIATVCDDLTLVFGFYAAFIEALLNFLLPGLFYIMSFKVLRKNPTSLPLLIISYIYVVIGAALFTAMNVNNIMKIVAALS